MNLFCHSSSLNTYYFVRSRIVEAYRLVEMFDICMGCIIFGVISYGAYTFKNYNVFNQQG